MSDGLNLRLNNIKMVNMTTAYLGEERDGVLEIILNPSTLNELNDPKFRTTIYNQILSKLAEINKCTEEQLPDLVKSRLSVDKEDVIKHELSHYFQIPEAKRDGAQLFIYFIGGLRDGLTKEEKQEAMFLEDDNFQQYMVVKEIAGELDFNIEALTLEERIRVALAPERPSKSDVATANTYLDQLSKSNPEIATSLRQQF